MKTILYFICIALMASMPCLTWAADEAEKPAQEAAEKPAEQAEEPMAEAEGEVMETGGTEMPSDLPPTYLTLGVRTGEDEVEGFGDVLIPAVLLDSGLIFVNPRYSRSDYDEEEVNIGVGYRHLVPNRNMILGANAYYDYRHTANGGDFHQLGLGLECLTEWVDARFNYYLPEDKTEKVREWSESSSSESSSSWFEWDAPYGTGNSIVQEGVRKTRTTRTTTTYYYEQFEEALEGFDCEVGVKLPIPVVEEYADVKVFGGYYHYNSSFGGDDPKGAKGRLEIRAVPSLYLDAEVFENDDLYGTDYFLGARVSMPFEMDGAGITEGFSLKKRDMPFYTRLGEMVMRDLHVITELSQVTENTEQRTTVVESSTDESDRSETLATDVTFVDGDRGDDLNPGTQEEPKQTVGGGVSNNTSVVFTYSYSTSYNENVYIDRDIIMLGQGDPIGYDGLTVDNGPAPIINGGGGPMPTIIIDGDAGASDVLIRGFILKNQGSVGDLILAANNVNNLEISYNTFDTALVGAGIDYDNGATHRLSMHNNTFKNLGLGVGVLNDLSHVDVDFMNNTVRDSGAGLFAMAAGPGAYINVNGQNNMIYGGGVGNEAIEQLVDNFVGPGFTPLPDNLPSGAGLIAGAMVGATADVVFANNYIEENLIGTAGFAYGPMSVANLDFNNNVYNGAGSAAIMNYLIETNIIPPGIAFYTNMIPYNRIDLGAAAMVAAGVEYGTVNLSAKNNEIHNHIVGVGFGGYGAATANVEIANNNMQGNLLGVVGIAYEDVDMDVYIHDNTINGGGLAPALEGAGITNFDYGLGGVTLFAADGSSVNNARIMNNTIKNHIWGNGLLSVFDNEMNNAQIIDNNMNDNLIGVLAAGGGENNTINDLWIEGNSFDGGGWGSLADTIGIGHGFEAGVAGVLLVAIDETYIDNATIVDNVFKDNVIGVGMGAYGWESVTRINYATVSSNVFEDNLIGVLGFAMGSTSRVNYLTVQDNVIDGNVFDSSFDKMAEELIGGYFGLSGTNVVSDLGLGGVLLVAIDDGRIWEADILDNTINDQVIGIGALSADMNFVNPYGAKINDLNVTGNTLNDNWFGVLGIAGGTTSTIRNATISSNTITGSGLGPAAVWIEEIVPLGLTNTVIPDYGIGGVTFLALGEAEIPNLTVDQNTINDHLWGAGLLDINGGNANNARFTGNTIDDALLGILAFGYGDDDATMNNLLISGNTISGSGLDTIGSLIGTNLPAMGGAGILVGLAYDSQANNITIANNDVNDFAIGIGLFGGESTKMNNAAIRSNNVDNALAGIVDFQIGHATNRNLLITDNILTDTMLGISLFGFDNSDMRNPSILDNSISNALIGVTAYAENNTDMRNLEVFGNTVYGGASAEQLMALDTLTDGLGFSLTNLFGSVGTNLLAGLPAGQGMAGAFVYNDDAGNFNNAQISTNSFTGFATMALVNSEHSAAPELDLLIQDNVNDINPFLPAVTGIGNDLANVVVTNNVTADGIVIIP